MSPQLPSSSAHRRQLSPSAIVALVVLAIALVAAAVYALPSHKASSGRPTKSDTVPATAPASIPPGVTLKVAGTEIVEPNGQQFLPYGIVVNNLAALNWKQTEPQTMQQVQAIAKVWHGNTVRLQIAPENLFPSASSPPDQGFLNEVKSVVNYARSVGLVAIVTAQTEKGTTTNVLPNEATLMFWKTIAPIFKNDQGVWYDLFNEPRLVLNGTTASNHVWHIWQDGGTGYVGMQALVDTVRSAAPNIILAEGPDFARTLNLLSRHMLTGYDIVYEVHTFFVRTNRTPAQWATNWGNYANKVPLLIGAWSEYEGQKADCVGNAATLVPQFLSYVHSLHIGLIGWTLQAGVLIAGTDLDDPTQFLTNRPYVCSAQAASSQPQGAGADLMGYFQQNYDALPNLS